MTSAVLALRAVDALVALATDQTRPLDLRFAAARLALEICFTEAEPEDAA